MSSGGVTAQFNFLSYKIDSINLKMKPDISYLLNTNPVRPENLHLNIKLRSTEKFNINDSIQYVGGLSTKIIIIDEKTKGEILEGTFGISGVFTPVGSVDNAAEDNFAKINLPALLMPYLRAVMTNVLSNAGFGTFLFPLVNVYELAKNQNFPVIDHTKQPS
jgi:preprotein translocase subunit SecB